MQSIFNRIAVILRDNPFPTDDGLADGNHTRKVAVEAIDAVLGHFGRAFHKRAGDIGQLDAIFDDIDVLVCNALVFGATMSRQETETHYEKVAERIFALVKREFG